MRGGLGGAGPTGSELGSEADPSECPVIPSMPVALAAAARRRAMPRTALRGRLQGSASSPQAGQGGDRRSQQRSRGPSSAPRCAAAGVSRPVRRPVEPLISRPAAPLRDPRPPPRASPLSSPAPRSRGGNHRDTRPCTGKFGVGPRDRKVPGGEAGWRSSGGWEAGAAGHATPLRYRGWGFLEKLRVKYPTLVATLP